MRATSTLVPQAARDYYLPLHIVQSIWDKSNSGNDFYDRLEFYIKEQSEQEKGNNNQLAAGLQY